MRSFHPAARVVVFIFGVLAAAATAFGPTPRAGGIPTRGAVRLQLVSLNNPHNYGEVPSVPSRRTILHATSESDDNSSPTSSSSSRRPCFYRSPGTGRWTERLELSDLTVGQELEATIVQELLKGKTGPKVYCEVGVGRYHPHRPAPTKDWSLVTALLRLHGKASVAAKRAARLRKKPSFPVYVHKVRLENQQLEVCLTPEGTIATDPQPARVSITSLDPGMTVTGRVVRVEPYGVLVDVGANRPALLHITKVANLMHRYIDKEKGLVEAGLERGAQVKLRVCSRDKKRVFLDFTDEVQQEAEAEHAARQRAREERRQQQEQQPKQPIESSQAAPSVATAMSTTDSTFQLSEEEERAWAAYASTGTVEDTSSTTTDANQEYDEDNDDEEYYDDGDYDEDKDIEDALGLGFY